MALNKKTMLYLTLARALSMKRPSKSDAERALAAWLAQHVPEHLRSKTAFDAAGNLHVDARLTPDNRTLFVAHMDTVHRQMGPNKIRKTETHWYASGDALGADDGAGCAMLMQLLHAGVAAYFCFTVAEECGGIGATWLANNQRGLLSEFDRAIAFDRRGIDSVITHQGYGRTASDVFAQALADALNDDMTLMYLPDDTGVYTDTAEFIDIIPECTNIGVGYYNEHSDREKLDILHFVDLANRVAKIDWDALPTDRDPTAHEYKSWGAYGAWMTGVNDDIADWDTKHHLMDDGDDYADGMRIELEEAIYEAKAGYSQWLIELIAESVWPEDPPMAERMLDRKRLENEQLLATAMRDLKVYDPSVVMATLFDNAYTA